MKWKLLVIGAVILGVVAWLLGRRGFDPTKAVKLELDVLDAKTKTEKLLVNQEASKVRRKLEAEHKATIERFNSDQKKQAERLANDPVALSAFLIRAAGKRS